jgi:hypothetical protein
MIIEEKDRELQSLQSRMAALEVGSEGMKTAVASKDEEISTLNLQCERLRGEKRVLEVKVEKAALKNTEIVEVLERKHLESTELRGI